LQKLPSSQGRKQIQKALRKNITKTIAAFLNTVGGTLLIGVSDSGNVLGIEPDFAYLGQGKNNTDGWLLSLKDVIVNALGPEIWSAIHVSLVPYGQQTVALIQCARRTTETWHREEGGEHFYIRASNATQELIGSSILRYIREHWPA
jgi:predicted HTH transcriptional regulator